MPDHPWNAWGLEGKVALVTGGSRGLGRAMVLGFAAAGADVVIASRKLENCEKLAREVEETTGRRALARAVHVGRWEETGTLVDDVYAELGRIDVLVNNAGISPSYDRLVGVTEALFDKVVDVNLKGPFRLTALVGDRMVENGTGGSIINISSIAAVQPTPGNLPYSAAKAGLDALTAGFAQAYGPTVRVNSIMPGAFMTDIVRGWDLEHFRETARSFPLARGGEPDEIVGTALYLASDASSFTTGTVIKVDGGQTLGLWQTEIAPPPPPREEQSHDRGP